VSEASRPAPFGPRAGSATEAGVARHPGQTLPAGLRAFVRARETGIAIVALLIGLGSGLLVVGMGIIYQRMHEILFGLPRGLRLSLATVEPNWRTLAVVTGGGVALALLTLWAGQRFKGRVADAIEANALHGGRMSLGGSLYISVQTMISNGFGASVGLEAAYTQICGAFASLFGRALAARRSDMRLLVACGAAGAISAAFDAPLTGAFYAFELVLGAYSVGSLVPVAGSAIVASLVSGHLASHRLISVTLAVGPVNYQLFGHIVAVALLASFVSITLMTAVARIERAFNATGLPAWPRPIIGGILVGLLGMVSTQVLGAGHGAFTVILIADTPVRLLVSIATLKFVTSAISLGAGFRGGLFFASLLIGGLAGRAYADGLALGWPTLAADPASMAILGMAAVGTGVLGSPVAMTCLALELTGDLPITVAALIASSITALVVRETFGYSFATWRFHLRGETIRGPHDIGWVRDLKAGRLMRRDMRTVAANRTIAAARIVVAPDASKEIALTDSQGRYAGLVVVSDLHSTTLAGETPISALARFKDAWLLPTTPIRRALDLFEREEADVLAVLDTAEDRRVVGWLSEAHALRRYGQELEKRNRENIGG
jgi:CIC family chloride channel protein